jgi:hypothetical protein
MKQEELDIALKIWRARRTRGPDFVCEKIARGLADEPLCERNKLAAGLVWRDQRRIDSLRTIILEHRGNNVARLLAESTYAQLAGRASLRELKVQRRATNRILRSLSRAARQQRQRERWAQRTIRRSLRSRS